MFSRFLLVYKQHRFVVLATLAIGLFITVGSIVQGLRLDAISFPANCPPYAAREVEQGMLGTSFSAECLAASRQWLDIGNGLLGHLIPSPPWFLPLFFGILLGAPLVAGEIESGTAPLSWALAGSRRSWLLYRIAAMLVLLLPLLLAIGLSSDYLDAATKQLNPWASFVDYPGRGVIVVFWGLAAFVGTVALSTLFGRTVPALVVAFVVCLVALGGWEAGMNRTSLAPFEGMLVTQAEARSGQFGFDQMNDLVTRYELWLDGKQYAGDINQWFMEHQPQPTVDPNGNLIYSPPEGPMPYQVPFGFPTDMYWPIVAYESGILFAGSIFCAGVALFWVGRRRPY